MQVYLEEEKSVPIGDPRLKNAIKHYTEGNSLKSSAYRSLKEQVIALHKEGIPIKQIQILTKLGYKTITRYNKEAGLIIRDKSTKMKQEKLKEGIELYKQGYSLKTAAKIVNITSVTLSKHVKALRIPIRGNGITKNINLVFKMHREGNTLENIHQETGIGIESILQYLNIPELYNNGYTIKGIARIISLSEFLIKKCLKNFGFSLKRGGYSRFRKKIIERGIQLYDQGRSLKESAEIIKVNPNTLKKYIKQAGVPLREKRSADKKYDEEILNKALELYKEGLGFRSIEKLLKVPTSTAWSYAKASGIPIRQKNGYSIDVVENVLKLYELGHPYKDIAKSTNLSITTICRYIKKAGIPTIRKKRFSKESIEKAIQLYKKGHTIYNIKKITGIGRNSLLRHVKMAKIPIRGQASKEIN